jgi:pimeloyl-ACP methyl ester carboxylesterase
LPGDDLVVDGVRLHVVRHGRDGHAGEPPILFLHGLGTTSRLWSDVVRDLEHDHRSIVPDLAACGRSERPAHARCTPAAQAQLMLDLLTQLEHERAVVVGHDIGGAIAVHMAALAPERVITLVLMSAPLHADAWPPRATKPLRLPAVGRVLTRLAGVRPEIRSRAVAAVAGGAVVSDADCLRGATELATSFDATATEAALDVVAAAPPPTLVLWGEDDSRLAPSYGARIVAAVPDSTWVPIAGAAHLVPTDRPERVAEEIAGFLADVPALATD